MLDAPTRGAVDHVRAGWTERPVISLSIRIVLFALPILSGWLAVRLVKSFFWQSPGLSGLLIWVVQAIVVAGLASFVATNFVRRLLPLAALFQLTLVFPDHAPSRLGIALRSGTVKKMKANLELAADSQQIAAEKALELITQLGRHERLTRGHTERVRARAEMIGVEMGLEESEIQLLRWGVLLHDIGKLGVPPEILNKESKLTDEEWAIMREHPAIGAEIVAPLSGWLGDWVHAAGQHHERWDGGGYPDGLAGTDISLAGRITAVADAYDVITSKRSYKEAMSDEAARRELVRCSGNQFDPVVVRAALHVGLRGPQRSGFASWLFELPAIARFLTAVPSVAAAAALAVAASVSAQVPASNPPEAVAMSAEPPVVEETPAEATVIATSDPPVIVTTSTVSSVSVPEVSTTSAATVAPAVTTTTSSQAPSPTTTETVVAPTVTTTQVPITTTAVPTTTTTTTAVPTTTTTTTTVVPTTTTMTTVVPTTTTTTIAPEPPPVGPEPLPLPQTTPIVVLRGDEVPDDLTLAAQPTLMSRSRVFIIEEDQFVTLEAPLDLYYERSFRASAREPNVTIPAGRTVCSWLVRYETLTEGLNSKVFPKIDFQSEVLGIAFLRGDLNATSELALDGIPYSTAGLEQGDRVEIAGSTISFSWTAGNASIDQARVVTDCSTP